MKTYLYRSSKFEVNHHFTGLSFIAEVNFWHPLKTVISCVLFIIIIIIIFIINFFRLVFSECTEAIATSLMIHSSWDLSFIIGFSCTMWTKMRSFAGSLADGVLADTILIPPCPPIPPTNIRKVRGRRKKYGN